MFSSNSTNPFGQSSNSVFGSQPVFGQTSNSSSNPFAPKPFGSPTASPFGAQSGSAIFGSTSTGVFGQTPAPLTFGASSSPAFGSSTPAFGASSSPAFGSGSIFGQKPAFGGFGSSPAQSSPFGSSFQQSQPAFGSTGFGSTTPFGASSQPAFGSTSTSAFGPTSNPAFRSTGFGAATPAFGASSTPAFGATSTPAFGSTTTPTFGSTGTTFGASSAPAFGSGGSSLFGSPSTPSFGASSTPFGASSTPAFGSSATTAFGAPSTPSFGFGSTPAFGSTQSSFGAQSSPFGGQTSTPAFGQTSTPAFGQISTPAFGQTSFGGQQGGSRVVAYTPTVDSDGASSTQTAGKLESISAMPAYKDKSHEELRWEDYQRGDKGGPNPASQPGQPALGIASSAPAQANPFGSTGTFGQTPGNTFASSSGGLFGQKPPAFGSTGFGSSSSPAFGSPFPSASSSPFGLTSTTPLFGASSGSGFSSGSSAPSIFGSSTTSTFGISTPFGSTTPAAGSAPAFGSGLTFGNTQSAGLFQSSAATAQTPSIFGQPSTGFGQTNGAFGSNLFGTPSTGLGGGLFGSSTPSLVPSTPGAFGVSNPAPASPFPVAGQTQTSGGFSFGNFGQAQPGSASGFACTHGTFGQPTFGHPSVNQQSIVAQPAPMTNPFGALPAIPEMSIGLGSSFSPVQYGISSLPVSEKPPPVRISSLLTARHVSQRRLRMPERRFRPKSDGPRVPFFQSEDVPSIPKADALFIPRENPRALIVRPIEQWPSRLGTEKQSLDSQPRSVSCPPVHENGNAKESNINGNYDNASCSSKSTLKLNGFHDGRTENGTSVSHVTLAGQRAGKAAVVYEHGARIEALLPKFNHPEYYTEPPIQELAAKERAEPGFCCHVKDFVVGRHGYGSIKFEGETDISGLDLESLVQLNSREVIVYKDESKKPPVGQGLNKPAEVTLLNVKCINKKTGQVYTEGTKVQSYKELLTRKTEEQGAEFVSYDAIKGEWKFKVKHFSTYGFGDEQ